MLLLEFFAVRAIEKTGYYDCESNKIGEVSFLNG